MNRKRFAVVFVLLLAVLFAGCAADELDAGTLLQPEVTATPAQEVTGNVTPPTGIERGEETGSLQPEAAPSGDAAVIAALEGTLERIYTEVNPSVVHIQVLVEGAGPPAEIPGFDFAPRQPQRGEGSGFVWDGEGHIVTNNHVVEDATRINVIFSEGQIVPATLVGSDADSDLAVLQVDVPPEQLHPVQLGDSTQVRVGELVIAIGNPFGQEGSLTVGFVSALGRLLPLEAATPGGPSYSIPDVIQTDAAINPGNSGGVLLDDQGHVIGVTTAILSPARVSAGIGFAVPAHIVERVVPALIEDGAYQHPYLGIEGRTLTPPLAEAMDLPQTQRGALVINVTEDGPAAEAGLQGSVRQATLEGADVPVGGDVIVALNETPVQGMDDLITQLFRQGAVGESITLTLIRDGREQSVDVTLQPRPATPAPEPREVRQAWIGIRATTLTSPVAEAMNLPSDQRGVLIGEVVEDSPAEDAGLRSSDTPLEIQGQEISIGGDVIVAFDGRPTPTMQALQQALAQYTPGDEVLVTILRDGEERELSLTLGHFPGQAR